MHDALVAGQRDPVILAGLARMSLRNKTEQLTQALRGRFTDHHAFLVRVHLHIIDSLAGAIEELTARITTALKPFADTVRLLSTIPGISDRVAATIIAETGADMTQFPTAGAPRVLGRGLSQPPRIRRAGRLDRDPAGERAPQSRTRQRRHGSYPP